jgi:hypothetical protein
MRGKSIVGMVLFNLLEDEWRYLTAEDAKDAKKVAEKPSSRVARELLNS